MKIWLINQYNMPPEYGHLNRHFNFGKYLKLLGHEPTVFVGSFLHNTGIQMIEDDSIMRKYENSNYPYYFIKTCDYSSSKTKRIYAMYEFYKNLIKTVRLLEKPDVIIGSSAHPLAAIAAINLGKKYKCQSIVEVRDLWPESIVAYGIISKKNPLTRILYEGEKWIYKNADKLIFTMEGGKNYIIEQCWDKGNGGPIDISKVFHINNGVDLEVYNFNKSNYIFNDVDLDDSNIFKVVYTGSVRLVNKVNILVSVANQLRNTNIKFLVWGDGDQVEKIRQRIKDEQLHNIILKGGVSKKFIPYILSKADLNIILGETSEIFRFGLSPNKLFEYFAAGKPILQTFKTNYSIVEKNSAGIELSETNSENIAEKVDFFSKLDKSQYQKFCENSLRISKNYDFEKLTDKLIEIIEN